MHFDPAGANVVIGWATSSTAVTNPSSASGGGLAYHNTGFGLFGLTMADARSASYTLWSSWASAGTGGGNGTTPEVPSTPGNSTCPTTNTIATVSDLTYDYIVAGGGAAGIIAAERLAEGGKSVLLIERGQASNYASGGRSVMSWNETTTQYDVPSMAYYLSSANDTSGYCTDVASQAGCILGGGTTVNALMFVRPQAADFDDKWPAGWKFADVSAAADRLYERNPGTTLASKDGQRYDQSVSLLFYLEKLLTVFRHGQCSLHSLAVSATNRSMRSRSQMRRPRFFPTHLGLSSMASVPDQLFLTFLSQTHFPTSPSP